MHIVSPDVAALHTGHGNVMPQSLHGGPGRAGGGEELGGLRALGFGVGFEPTGAFYILADIQRQVKELIGDARGGIEVPLVRMCKSLTTDQASSSASQ